MKITIEEDGKEPIVFDEVSSYQLITLFDEGDSYSANLRGSSNDTISVGEALAMARAVEKLFIKFKPLIDFDEGLKKLNNDEEV